MFQNRVLLGRKIQPIYIVIVLMSALSTVWMSYEFWRLIWQPIADNGAVDLNYRYQEVTSFVAGIPVYWELSDAVYPPASYLMMWPLIGWLPEGAVRPYWAITTVACLALLIAQVFHILQPQKNIQKVFLGLLPLCLYATGAAIGNGQIVLHLLPCLLGSFILLQEMALSPGKQDWQVTWARNGLISLLMILALVKPNVTAPFFWILLFKSPVSGVITATAYAFLTTVSAYFQPEFDGPVELFKGWLTMGMAGAYYGATPYVEYEGGGSLETSVSAHSILGFFNFEQLDFVEFSGWNQLASFSVLAILGVWIYRNRSRNIWILASVAAIASKYWTYHGGYDDVILLIPMLLLFNLSTWTPARSPARHTQQAAKLAKESMKHHHSLNRQIALSRKLFACLFIVMLAPGGAYLLPMPWRSIYLILQTVTIITVLVFIAYSQPVNWPSDSDSAITSL